MIYFMNSFNNSRTKLYDFDFTQSLADSIHNQVATLNGTSGTDYIQDSNGITLMSNIANINLNSVSSALHLRIFSHEVDVGDCNVDINDNLHKRFFMWSHNAGLIYRVTNTQTPHWGIYITTTSMSGQWYDTDITDKDYFKNSTLKVKFNNPKIYFYKNGNLFYTISNAGNDSYNSYYSYGIGGNGDSGSQSINDITIKALRIYAEQED